MYRLRDGLGGSAKCFGQEVPAISELIPQSSGNFHSLEQLSEPSSPTIQVKRRRRRNLPGEVSDCHWNCNISHLLNQTAQLIAVNAQLKKEIEQVRASGAMVPGPGSVSIAPPHEVPFLEQHHNNNANGVRPPNGKKSPKPESYKTVMCQAWLESKVCLFGENCRFAHGEQELRPSRIAPKQNNKYKTKLCDKYTTTGLCPYGTRCLFIHPDNGGTNAYIRSDRLMEVSQRHALADMNAHRQQRLSRAPSPFAVQSIMSEFEATPRGRPCPPRPPPSWPLEPAAFFQKQDDVVTATSQVNIKELFGCFDTPNRVSLGGVSEYGSGGSSPSQATSSPFSTTSSSSINLNVTDDERDFEFFRLTGLDSLAEELTRNLTTNELW